MGVLRHASGALCALLLLGHASGAGAQEANVHREAARALAVRGHELYEQGKYEGALALLTEAEQRFHAPTHLLHMARAQARLGRFVDAFSTYDRLLAETLPAEAPEPYKQAQAEAAADRAALEKRAPRVRITLRGPAARAASVTIDRRAVPVSEIALPRVVDAGWHEIVVLAPGAQPLQRSFRAIEGEIVDVPIELASSAALSTRTTADAEGENEQAMDWRLPAGIAAVLVSVGFVGTGVAASVVVADLEEDPDLEAYRRKPGTSDVCKDAAADGATKVVEVCDQGETFEAVQLAAFLLGAASAGAAVWLLATAESSKSKRSPSALVQPSVGARGGRVDLRLAF